MLDIAYLVHQSALNLEKIDSWAHVYGLGCHAGKGMASVHVPNVLINLCALCRSHILNRMVGINCSLLAFENELDLLRKGMAYGLVLNLAMVTAESKGGHAQGKVCILLATLSLEMQGTTIMTWIIHGPK